MRRALAAAALLALGPGCRHARQIGSPEPAPRQEAGPAQPARPGGPPVAPSPEGFLAPGAVAQVQEALAARGYLGGHRTGDLDVPTSAALRRFQEREGLAATGAPDRETVRRLGLDPDRLYRSRQGEGERG